MPRCQTAKPRTARGAVLLLGIAGGVACAPISALDLQLVPDPEWTDAPRVLELAERIRVVVDSPQGLYPASAAGRHAQILLEDVDADGAVELSTELELAGMDHLPLLRLERGGLPDVPIEVRFDGIGGSPQEIVAGGSARGLVFEPEQVVEKDVLFKPRMRLLPPRVTQVIPGDGAIEQRVGSVFVVFPKQMNAESLRAPGTVTLLAVTDGAEQPVPVRELRVQFLPGAESPTTVEYQLQEILAPGRYRVRVSEQALDLDGRALDQVPTQPGNQPFASQFEVSATAEVTTTMACPLEGPCTEGPCGLAGSGATCASGLECVDGACVPQECPAACPVGTVCDTATALCVVDCRDYGAGSGCAPELPRCGADGVCRAP